MSLPLVPSPGSFPLSSGSSARDSVRLAKATREFQSLFLMELLRPLTEGLARDGLASGSLGGGRDLYSWFWSEALASRLAGSWPLPEVPGAAAPGASGAGVISRTSGSLRAPASIVAGGSLRTPAPALSTGVAREAAPTAPNEDEAAAPRTLAGVDELVRRAGRLFELPVNLLRAVVSVESSGRTDAVSSKGAVGLMQIMPATAREMGIQNPSDPWENLYAGAKYLSRQLARFGDLHQALAAYNAGPGAVEAHEGIPPYPETRAYVRKVMAEKARLDLDLPGDA